MNKSYKIYYLIKDFFDTFTSFNNNSFFFNSHYLFPKFQTPKAAMRKCIHFTLSLENSASLERMAKDDERVVFYLREK